MNFDQIAEKREVSVFKQKKNYFAVVLMALFITLAAGTAPSQAAPAASTVGYADFLYLIDHHPDTPKANEALKAEQEAVKKEFAEKSAGLNDVDKQNLDRQLRLRLEQKRQELLKPIADKVMAIVKGVADAKGLSIVISNREVIYGGVDITPEVLAKLTGK